MRVPCASRAAPRATAAVRDGEGRVLMGALGTMCDAIGGFCGGLGALPDGWVVTTNMMLRAASRPAGDEISLESEVLRVGKSAVVTSVRAHDREGFVVGGVVRSAVLVPEGGPPPVVRPARLDLRGGAQHDTPFTDWLAPRAIAHADDDRGVEITLRDDFRNPWGIMHGGVTSAVVDAAAREAVPGYPHDVVIHFLSPARVGPVVGVAAVLGHRPDGRLVRVDVRDRGAEDRIVAIALATVS